MTHPCTECERRDADKSGPECRDCQRRVDYATGIARRDHSIQTAARKPAAKYPAAPAPAPPPPAATQPEAPPAATKICNRADCPMGGAPQPLDAFYRHNATTDGRSGHCKACAKAADHRRFLRIKAARAVARAERAVADATQTGRATPRRRAGAEVAPPAQERPKADQSVLEQAKASQSVPKPAAESRWRLVLDFTGRPELLSAISTIADAEFRTPDQQVMYWLSGRVRTEAEALRLKGGPAA
jgi:hypothetical protein